MKNIFDKAIEKIEELQKRKILKLDTIIDDKIKISSHDKNSLYISLDKSLLEQTNNLDKFLNFLYNYHKNELEGNVISIFVDKKEWINIYDEGHEIIFYFPEKNLYDIVKNLNFFKEHFSEIIYQILTNSSNQDMINTISKSRQIIPITQHISLGKIEFENVNGLEAFIKQTKNKKYLTSESINGDLYHIYNKNQNYIFIVPSIITKDFVNGLKSDTNIKIFLSPLKISNIEELNQIDLFSNSVFINNTKNFQFDKEVIFGFDKIPIIYVKVC